MDRTASVAAGWVVAGMVLIALCDNLIPMVADRMGLWQFQLMRGALILPFVLLGVMFTGGIRMLIPLSAWKMAVRSLLAIIALMLYFAALPAVSISVAAAGLFTSPIWATIFSALLLGERVDRTRVAAALIGFTGVCIVLGVGSATIQPMALVAVVGGAFYALSMIWTRQCCAGETAVGMAFWQFVGFILLGLAGLAGLPVLTGLFAGVEGLEFAIRPWVTPDADAMWLALAIGAIGIAATSCIATGYKSADSSFIGIFDFSFLLWAPMISWLFYSEVMEIRTAVGMGLIVTAGLVAMSPNWRREARADTGLAAAPA